ncbi:MAG: hypothetical protein KAS66_08110 [Candidatus Omnitrophica bacterium]|nr:hypothetical protein [Candidatus Omnitrophota bacterium]
MIIGSIGTAAAATGTPTPLMLIDSLGLSPAEWMGIAVGLGAIVQHVGRYMYKKKADPSLTYDPSYAVVTLITVVSVMQLQMAIPVTELSFGTILFAFATGLGINEGASKATKSRML